MVNELIKDLEKLEEVNRQIEEIRKPDSDYIKTKVEEIFGTEKWNRRRAEQNKELEKIFATL